MSDHDFRRIFHRLLTHGNDNYEICEISGRTRRECGCAHSFAVFNPVCSIILTKKNMFAVCGFIICPIKVIVCDVILSLEISFNRIGFF